LPGYAGPRTNVVKFLHFFLFLVSILAFDP
jgi:hypothetical protein